MDVPVSATAAYSAAYSVVEEKIGECDEDLGS
jgi:hypothetical protein